MAKGQRQVPNRIWNDGFTIGKKTYSRKLQESYRGDLEERNQDKSRNYRYVKKPGSLKTVQV